MNTLRTEEFAKVCMELSIYFFDVAPDPRTAKRKRDGNEYDEEYIASYDNLKKQGFDGSVSQPPCKINTLRKSYSDFNNEIEINISNSDDGFVNKLVHHLFAGCLPYEKYLPYEEQFFRERMFDEAELLYTFKAISREINQRFGSLSLMKDPLPF